MPWKMQASTLAIRDGEPQTDTIDEAVLKEFCESVLEDMKTKDPEEVIETVYQAAKMGYFSPNAGITRFISCSECNELLFDAQDPDETQGLDLEICHHCNLMVHGKCAGAHLKMHLLLGCCRGFSKLKSMASQAEQAQDTKAVSVS